MNKTPSQNIAELFTIISFVLLIPGFFGMLMILWLALISPLCLLALIVPTIGIVLLIGYFKQSRGTINKKRIFPLWIGTFLYNLMFLSLASIYHYKQYTSEIVSHSYNNSSPLFSLFMAFLTAWWLAAVLLSITAIYSEKTRF